MIDFFRTHSDKWQNAPSDYSKSYAEKMPENTEQLENFIEKMLPLIEAGFTQYGDEDIEDTQNKKGIAENSGELAMPADLKRDLSISSSKVQNIDIGKSDPSISAVHYNITTPENIPSSVIVVYSMLSHQMIGYCIWKKSLITCFSLSPTDEMIIVAGNTEGEIFLYDIHKGKKRNTSEPININYSGHKASITSINIRSSLANSTSGLVASIDCSGTICFWRIDPVIAGMDITPSIEEILLGEYKLQLLSCSDLSKQYCLSDALPKHIRIDPRDTNS